MSMFCLMKSHLESFDDMAVIQLKLLHLCPDIQTRASGVDIIQEEQNVMNSFLMRQKP
jgi:hypothetical protein